jgi:hypothetical protein
MISSKNMIPLKDMHFRIRLHLSPEQEETMKKAILESVNRNCGESPRSPGPGVGYAVETMSIPEAFEWFQAMKLAYDQEQAVSSAGDKVTGGRNS